MQSQMKLNDRRGFARRGVSFVEFLGCLIALGGGLVLGSMYLGIDMQATAVGILEKADIQVPALLSGEPTVAEETTPPDPAESEGEPQLANDETSEDGLDAEEIYDEEEAEIDATEETVVVEQEPRELTEAEKQVATANCWTELNRCVREEVANRSKWMKDSESWQLFDYLLHRKDGHKQVVEAIEAIDLHGVDPRLRAHVQQVLAWQRAGEQLFDRATLLLTDAPAGKLSGPFAQSWQSAATQHRMEEKLILTKHAAVASYLEHANKISAAASSDQ